MNTEDEVDNSGPAPLTAKEWQKYKAQHEKLVIQHKAATVFIAGGLSVTAPNGKSYRVYGTPADILALQSHLARPVKNTMET